MQKILRSISQVEDKTEKGGDLPRAHLRTDKIQSKNKYNSRTVNTVNSKRWSKENVQREALLAFLNESEMMDNCVVYESLDKISRTSVSNHNVVNDVLNINPSDSSENALQQAAVPITYVSKKKKPKNDHFELLQHEVSHLREKFELNDRSYQIEDLMRLTVNSKNILNLERFEQKNTEHDKKIEDSSVYYDLECHRMSLEQKIGFSSFSKAYGKMIHIINDELDSFLKKNTFEKDVDLTETYFIKKVQVGGDSDDLIKNTWKSIIDVLGDKQEYLPDIWELAMSENICYHF